MKKLLFIFSALIASQFANAQESFYKHALVFSVGVGGEGYAITETYSVKGYPSLNYTTTGSAGSASYPFSLEYGLNKWIGIGLLAKPDKYFTSKDTNTGYTPSASGFEFGAIVNIHFLRTQHIDFLAGLDLGGSHFTYTADAYNDQVYGDGAWGDIHATLRFYFGRFGLYGSLSFPTMNYNLTSNNSNWNVGQDILATWKARGAAFNVGIQYRFLSAPTQ